MLLIKNFIITHQKALFILQILIVSILVVVVISDPNIDTADRSVDIEFDSDRDVDNERENDRDRDIERDITHGGVDTTYQNERIQTLKLINVLFRHGDRAPIQSYPTDPYANISWHNGYGGLSLKGIRQAFNMGVMFRQRYKRLIPKDGIYLNTNMKVISSMSERTILTTASFLAGFMPPPPPSPQSQRSPQPTSSTINLALPILWQPIPIYPIPSLDDKLLIHSAACPKYDKIYTDMLTNESSTFGMFQKDYNDLFQYLSKHTNKTIKNMFDVELLYDTLFVQQENGLALPEWTTEVFPDKMKYLYEQSVAFRTNTKFMLRIKSGPILTEFLDNIEKYITGKQNQTINIYGGHDTTIAYLMKAIRAIDQTTLKPDYVAATVFELHSNLLLKDDDDYEIRIVYYHNSETEQPLDIHIPNCKAPCSLKLFIKNVEHALVKDFIGMCKL